MPKVGVGPIRRKELTAATISVIHESALSDPTLAEISAKAGLSTSIINHYFQSKDKLLEHAMRELASGFIGDVTLGISAAETPEDRINAVIDANFAPSQCTPEAVSAWLWFWARVRSSEEFSKIQHTCDDYIAKELTIAVKELVPAEDVDDVVEGIMATMYGLYLRYAHEPEKIDVKTAQRITKDLVFCRVKESQAVSCE